MLCLVAQAFTTNIGRQSKEDLSELETRTVCLSNSRIAKTTDYPVSKKTNKITKADPKVLNREVTR